MAFSPTTNLLGLIVTGDCGGLTYYTDRRGRLIAFLQAPPHKPPSTLQIAVRNRFRQIAQNWAALSPAHHTQWARLAARLSICGTGFSTYTYLACCRTHATYRTLCAQSGITPPPPTLVPLTW